MPAGPSMLTIGATQPNSEVALTLTEAGLAVQHIEEEDNVDRFVLGPQVAVERRTARTFLQGIQDKTLFASAIFLRERFETAILVVEGEIDYDRTGFHPQAVRGALSSMMLEYGLSVVVTSDPMETARLIAMMARHTQQGVPEISLVPKRKAVDLPDLQRRVIEMLPGCGRVTARDLLQRFGSIERIVSATTQELREVRGIGTTRAAEIYAVLHAEYAAVDTERNLEDAIEAEPRLLFDPPIELIARQLVVSLDHGERHVVDMVFLDPAKCALILVELKRGELTAEHEAQLRRYLDDIHRSPMLMDHIGRGVMPRGLLVTVTPCDYVPTSPDIDAIVIDTSAVIEVLKELRERRWSE